MIGFGFWLRMASVWEETVPLDAAWQSAARGPAGEAWLGNLYR